jgi:hypothetical protein
MKNFADYLTESKKTYQFKVGVAGELPEGFDDRLKLAMEKFSIVNLTKGKKTPIQERPLDFPNLNNTEVTYWDVEVGYPTTEAVIKEYLGQVCSVHESKIIVRKPGSPVERNEQKTENTVYEPLLAKEDMGGESAQNNVGNSRIMELLKELETARKERNDQDGFKMEAIKEEPQNTKSAIGSKK